MLPTSGTSASPMRNSQNVSDLLSKTDERKWQLLEGRIAGVEPPKINLVTPPMGEEKLSNSESQNLFGRSEMSFATIEDNIASPVTGQEMVYIQQNNNSRSGTDNANPIIILDSNSNGSHSRSNQDLSMKGIIGEKRPRDEDSRGGMNGDSVDRPKSPKFRHGDDQDNSPNQGDNGSRGAPVGPKQRDIKTYFTLHSSSGMSNVNMSSASLVTQIDSPAQVTNHSASTTSNIPQTNNSAEITRATTTSTSSSGRGKSSIKDKDKEKESVQVAQRDPTLIEIKKQLEQLKTTRDQLDTKLQRTEAEFKHANDKIRLLEDRNKKFFDSLEEVHRKMAMQEFRRKREKLALDSVRLGKIVTVRNGPANVIDVFEEGYAGKDLNRRFTEIIRRKEELEARKKRFQNLKRQAKKTSSSSSSATLNDNESETNAMSEADMDLDLATEAEVIRSHQEQIKRDENALAEEKRLLESEKAVHTKELKRCQCEERSRFYRDLPLLNKRYLLQCMLGRGGFSEVWKALDLAELREVAVKVHQLNPDWKDERKASYIKHVTREYTIHRDMKHPRVVQLYDVFEIDMNSFATVLEYCKGIDLDEKLKRQRMIPEKDARAVFMQIISGLRYLSHPFSYNFNGLNETINDNSGNNTSNGEDDENTGGNNNSHHHHRNGRNSLINKKLSIIHYDLKPANILFDEFGDVKITDFGLAKVIDEAEEGTSMELTSQGAGTYWYLPPECFHMKGPNPPRISSKVDVWSAGVIFYQMLYGVRPFGEGQSQENIWSEKTILNAHSVHFPTDPKAPKVSEEAKELIRRCLEHDYHRRPDVNTISQDPYLKNK